MKLGQLVMLVGTDDFMPPLGAIGEIVGLLDDDGDYRVIFPKYPCPVEDITWYAQAHWLMPITGLGSLDNVDALECIDVAIPESK